MHVNLTHPRDVLSTITFADPVFGKLTYDGNHHGGWATGVADERFAGRGSALEKRYGYFDEEEPAPRSSSEAFARQLLSIAGPQLGEHAESAERMLASAREYIPRRLRNETNSPH
jgi:hypothetical protein